MRCALDTMTNTAFTMNTFPDTEDPHALDADRQGATSPALPALNDQQGSFSGSGVLDITDGGFGFLRTERFLPGRGDIYVSASQIRRFGLRQGDLVEGQVRLAKDREQYAGLLRVESVDGIDPDAARRRPHFDTLTPALRAASDSGSGVDPLHAERQARHDELLELIVIQLIEAIIPAHLL